MLGKGSLKNTSYTFTHCGGLTSWALRSPTVSGRTSKWFMQKIAWERWTLEDSPRHEWWSSDSQNIFEMDKIFHLFPSTATNTSISLIHLLTNSFIHKMIIKDPLEQVARDTIHTVYKWKMPCLGFLAHRQHNQMFPKLRSCCWCCWGQ